MGMNKSTKDFIEALLYGIDIVPVKRGDCIAGFIAMIVLYLLADFLGRRFFFSSMKKRDKKGLRKREPLQYFSNSFIKRVFLIGLEGRIPKIYIITNAINIFIFTAFIIFGILSIITLDEILCYIMRKLMLYCFLFALINSVLAGWSTRRYNKKFAKREK